MAGSKNRIWIDPPEGWRYGFPKLYDPACGKPVYLWLREEGYPLNPDYIRQWFEDMEESSNEG